MPHAAAMHVSYAHQPTEDQIWKDELKYGRYITQVYLVVIAVFAICHACARYTENRPMFLRSSPPRISFWDRCIAAWRAVFYKRFSSKAGKSLEAPSAGVSLLLFLAFLVTALFIFVQKPYYRQKRALGSPQLGLRAGMIATALVPLTVALSGKANLISALTGFGHEKLNVLHRGISHILLFACVAHILPFLYQPLREGGFSTLNFYYYNDPGMGYTGTPTFSILMFLVIFSLPVIRRWKYEMFKRLHSLGAIVFISLMFWHTNNKHDSWFYLFATIIVWICSVAIRWFHNSVSNKSLGRNRRTTVNKLAGNAIRIDIELPAKWTWRPGQHVYIRIPRIGILDNHPFTIASIPVAMNSILGEKTQRARDSQARNTLSFLVRSRSGFTKRLQQHHVLPSSITCDLKLTSIIDGPYGTYITALESRYDGILLVAGGGGITAVLPHLLHVSACMKKSSGITRQIRLVWMVRDACCMEWINDDIKDLWDSLTPAYEINVDVYVTSSNSMASSLQSSPAVEAFPYLPSPTWPGMRSSISTHIFRLSRFERFNRSSQLIRHSRISQASQAPAAQPFQLQRPKRETLSTSNLPALDPIIQIPRVSLAPVTSPITPEIPFTPATPSPYHKLALRSSSFASNWSHLTPSSNGVNLHVGLRPLMMDVVNEAAARCQGGKRLAVIGCGPPGLKNDLSNSVASVQGEVLRGSIREAMLHTETFDW